MTAPAITCSVRAGLDGGGQGAVSRLPSRVHRPPRPRPWSPRHQPRSSGSWGGPSAGPPDSDASAGPGAGSGFAAAESAAPGPPHPGPPRPSLPRPGPPHPGPPHPGPPRRGRPRSHPPRPSWMAPVPARRPPQGRPAGRGQGRLEDRHRVTGEHSHRLARRRHLRAHPGPRFPEHPRRPADGAPRALGGLVGRRGGGLRPHVGGPTADAQRGADLVADLTAHAARPERKIHRWKSPIGSWPDRLGSCVTSRLLSPASARSLSPFSAVSMIVFSARRLQHPRQRDPDIHREIIGHIRAFIGISQEVSAGQSRDDRSGLGQIPPHPSSPSQS